MALVAVAFVAVVTPLVAVMALLVAVSAFLVPVGAFVTVIVLIVTRNMSVPVVVRDGRADDGNSRHSGEGAGEIIASCAGRGGAQARDGNGGCQYDGNEVTWHGFVSFQAMQVSNLVPVSCRMRAGADETNIGLGPESGNNRARLFDNTPTGSDGILNIGNIRRIFERMKISLRSLLAAMALTFAGTVAQAACIAEYKAVRDNPFDLTYGVMKVPGNTCTRAAVRPHVVSRLRSKGWNDIQIISVRSE